MKHQHKLIKPQTVNLFRKPGRRSTATATGQEMTPLKKPDEENGVQSGTEA